MQKLGQLLAQAGVQGADKDTKTRTELLQELQGMSKVRNFEPTHSHRAIELLPPEFKPLEACEKGQEFLATFAELAHTHQPLITREVIHGVSQLAHRHRDEKGGSKRKSFDKIIAQILDLKGRVEKKENGPAIVSSVLNVSAKWLSPEYVREKRISDATKRLEKLIFH